MRSVYALAFVNNANRTATLSCDTSCIRMLLEGSPPAPRGYIVRQDLRLVHRSFCRLGTSILSSLRCLRLGVQVRDLWEKRSLGNTTAAAGIAMPVAGGGAVRLVTLTAAE